ncbi:MAG: VOC family protein [Chloroflexi bacterium]|nr:VOC family protein [Chloroflexota bacterium]
MLTSLDHFAILVHDLSAAIEIFRALGFDVRAGGAHPAFGSHNALIALADETYFELVAFQDTARAEQTFWRDAVHRLRVAPGFDNFVLLSSDLSTDISQLRARGLAVSDAESGARLRPDGERVAFKVATIGETRSGLLPFLIQDETPRALRVESARAGLGAQARVKQITIAAQNPEAAREKFQALFAIEARRVQSTTGDAQGYRFAFGNVSIVLAHPTRAQNALSDQLEKRGEGLHAVTLGVENFNRARSELVARGIKIEEDARGFLIAPKAACGARLRIVSAQ